MRTTSWNPTKKEKAEEHKKHTNKYINIKNNQIFVFLFQTVDPIQDCLKNKIGTIDKNNTTYSCFLKMVPTLNKLNMILTLGVTAQNVLDMLETSITLF